MTLSLEVLQTHFPVGGWATSKMEKQKTLETNLTLVILNIPCFPCDGFDMFRQHLHFLQVSLPNIDSFCWQMLVKYATNVELTAI